MPRGQGSDSTSLIRNSYSQKPSTLVTTPANGAHLSTHLLGTADSAEAEKLAEDLKQSANSLYQAGDIAGALELYRHSLPRIPPLHSHPMSKVSSPYSYLADSDS